MTREESPASHTSRCPVSGHRAIATNDRPIGGAGTVGLDDGDKRTRWSREVLAILSREPKD
jgi:hypothetical protein